MRLMGKRPASISGATLSITTRFRPSGGFCIAPIDSPAGWTRKASSRTLERCVFSRACQLRNYTNNKIPRPPARLDINQPGYRGRHLRSTLVVRQNIGFFRSAQAHQAIHRVRSALRCGMVVPNLQLTQKPKSEQLRPGENHHGGNHEQGPVLIHDVLMGEDLEREKEGGDAAAAEDAQRAD